MSRKTGGTSVRTKNQRGEATIRGGTMHINNDISVTNLLDWVNVFGHLPRLKKLTDTILMIGAHHLGIRDEERVLHELILDSVAPVALGLLSSDRIIDLGCGVGLPSIPLVAIVPGLRAVLIDERSSRLETALAWAEYEGFSDRIEIVKGRIERRFQDVSRETDQIVAKGLGGLDRIVDLVKPRKNPFRSMMIYSGESARDGVSYSIGTKRRRILLVSRTTILSTL